jgi:hypothetical protein
MSNGVPQIRVEWNVNITTILVFVIGLVASWVTLDNRVGGLESWRGYVEDTGMLPKAATEIATVKAQIDSNRRALDRIERQLDVLVSRQRTQ